MFIQKKTFSETIEVVQSLLKSHLYLDESKPEGLACRFKFNNNSLGVDEKTRLFLNQLASDIIANNASFETTNKDNILQIIDTLVLYSNHLDQQTSNEKNNRLPQEKKEMTVLHWLSAAKLLSDHHLSEKLDDKNCRDLSSIAQLYHYLGKALRYNKSIALSDRMTVLQKAVDIANFLQTLKLTKELDPHAYNGRNATYQLPLIYSLQQLGEYDKAAVMMKEQLINAPDRFHQIQANTQLSHIFKGKYEQNNHLSDIETSIEYATTACKLAHDEGHTLLRYHAKVALMQSCDLADKKDDARQIANEILEDVAKNKNCGAKQDHIIAAEECIKRQHLSPRFS